MRIAELSRRTGVSVPTIKYYLREALLPPGELAKVNQAQYGETHVRRLRLVRALIEIGGLSVAGARRVTALIDAPGASVLDALGKAQYAMTVSRDPVEDEAWQTASIQVETLIEQRGWQVRPGNPARQVLAEVLAVLRRLGHDERAVLEGYAEVADVLAAVDLDLVLRQPDVDGMAEAAVVWTALGDRMLSALRRLAQEAEASRRFAESSAEADPAPH